VADRVPLDLDPPVRRLKELMLGITDEELDRPTPCPGWSVGDLLDHIMVLSRAFARAAQKRTDHPGTSTAPPPPSRANLPRHWRSRLPVLLEGLATAWQRPEAWTGTTAAGGVTGPAEDIGRFAANELVMHGWDLARATGQEFAADPRILEALIELLSRGPAGNSPGLVGPRFALDDDEPTLLEQALALAGRDPAWRPGRPGVSAASAPGAG
jgi:uncharacterized protein (TIGR03086 family)